MKENGANSKGCGLIQEAAIDSVLTFSLTGNYLFSTRESRHVANLTGKCGVESYILCLLDGFPSGDYIKKQNGYKYICCRSSKRGWENECTL